MNDSVIILEHIHLLDVRQGLHTYERMRIWVKLPNFLMADLSFLSSLTFWTATCFFFLLWVPEGIVVSWALTLASDLSGVGETSSELLSGSPQFCVLVHQFFRL